VILHPDQDRYSIGQSIRPRLQLWNLSDAAIEIHGFAFDWDTLAFSPPNEAHLIGPDGQDHLAPYRQPGPFTDAPVRVQARSEEWLVLPISAHVHLREIGSYRFWLHLVTDTGTAHTTRTLTFELTDVPSSIDPACLELEIAPVRSPQRVGEPVDLDCQFTNHAPRPLRFLGPQEDSFDGWVNPVYQFTVVDASGRSLAMARRDGTMARPVYDDEHLFRIQPGGTHRMALRLPVFPGMRAPGTYTVGLTYLVRDHQIGKGGSELDASMGWDDDVFIGRLESNRTTVTLT
jgi:hypothetical protein